MPKPAGSRGTYGQVADALRARIVGGELRPGGLLPSESRLCAEFGVARGTVRRALAELERDGVVRTQQGRPRVVVGGAAHEHSHERVAAAIREDIAAGRLRPGGRLPAEHALAAQHGVSRVTVRQALQSLQEEGIVDVPNRRGRFVSPCKES